MMPVPGNGASARALYGASARTKEEGDTMAKSITMHIDSDKLGTDAKYPEAFTRYCEERLARRYPDAEIDVILGAGSDDLPEGTTGNEYIRLAEAILADRRAGYLAAVDNAT